MNACELINPSCKCHCPSPLCSEKFEGKHSNALLWKKIRLYLKTLSLTNVWLRLRKAVCNVPDRFWLSGSTDISYYRFLTESEQRLASHNLFSKKNVCGINCVCSIVSCELRSPPIVWSTSTILFQMVGWVCLKAFQCALQVWSTLLRLTNSLCIKKLKFSKVLWPDLLLLLFSFLT